MKHNEINSLQPGMNLESVYLVRDVFKKTRKSGEPFASLSLQDATGTVNAVMWDEAEKFLATGIRSGDFILVRGEVNQYNKQLQLTIREAKKVDPSLIQVEKFLPASPRPILEMKKELFQWIEQVKTPHLRALLDLYFGNDAFLAAFLRAPSARTMHQAYIGGLVEHTIGVVKNAVTIADNYKDVDRELLITGALLHDGSKVYEYSFQTSINYTDKGRLLGHLSMMAMDIENRARDIPGFPEETIMLLEHMILAHHGRREFGSPKVPMTAEAMILFYADYIDAYLSMYFEQKKKALEKGEPWTDWVDMFGSFLYAGSAQNDPEDNRTKEMPEQ